MRYRLLLGCVAFGLLAACSDHKEPAKDTPQVEGVIPQAQLDALNKAKGVEGTVMQQAEQQRKEIDAQ
jgi:hypothetical protein